MCGGKCNMDGVGSRLFNWMVYGISVTEVTECQREEGV